MYFIQRVFSFCFYSLYFFICLFYPELIFYYTILIFFYTLREYYFRKENLSSIPLCFPAFKNPVLWIDAIVNIFYYIHLQKKHVIITLGYEDALYEKNYSYEINLSTPVSYEGLKFFIDTNNDYLIFFITDQGILEKLVWNAQEEILLFSSLQFAIQSDYEISHRKFIVQTKYNLFLDMNKSSLFHFIEVFLQKNRIKK